MKRRITKSINVGGVKIGGDAPISVQSMTKTDTRDVKATVSQIKGLEEAGCQIVRCAVPDMEAAEALAEIKKQVKIPIVADIHFHHQLALKSLESGVDCLRLNPGNIRDRTKVEEIVKASKDRAVPIRIGVNFGSLPPVGKIGLTGGISRHTDGVNELPKAGDVEVGQFTIVDHMVETGLWEISILEDLDFDLIKISLKAFDIDTTVEAYRRMAKLVPYPLHLGITEAGTAKGGSIRTSIGLGILLFEGIGDTIRVSLSDEPNEEIITGLEILKSLGLRKEGATLVACPSCGRADVDIRKLANTVEDLLRKTKTPVKVAVMGCEVNGPGEARQTDLGITGGGNGNHQVYLAGVTDHIIKDEALIEDLIKMVERKAREIAEESV